MVRLWFVLVPSGSVVVSVLLVSGLRLGRKARDFDVLSNRQRESSKSSGHFAQYRSEPSRSSRSSRVQAGPAGLE